MYKNYRRERQDFAENLPAVLCNLKAGEIKKFLKKIFLRIPKSKMYKKSGRKRLDFTENLPAVF